jgi:hypothetical protein
MVEYVEKLAAELDIDAVPQVELAMERKIHSPSAETTNEVSAKRRLNLRGVAIGIFGR